MDPYSPIIFKGVPIPPSSNRQYNSFTRHSKIVHVRSRELLTYQESFACYAIEHLDKFKSASEFLGNSPLSVHAIFGFFKNRLLTKTHKMKQLDVSNRFKALHDCLGKALGIDDSMFVSVSAEKRFVELPQPESVTLYIQKSGLFQFID